MEVTNINDVTPEEIEHYSSNVIPDESTAKDRLLLAFKNILDFYYGDVSSETILNFAPNSEDGFTKESVLDIATEMGLNAVCKDIPASDIAHYFLPCIIFDKKG
ncbi:MAG TPA: hypothetical protein EYG73_06875, partial [Arcobacter sp.]|nr:hypothetical protein [Arcobacter sp.]